MDWNKKNGSPLSNLAFKFYLFLQNLFHFSIHCLLHGNFRNSIKCPISRWNKSDYFRRQCKFHWLCSFPNEVPDYISQLSPYLPQKTLPDEKKKTFRSRFLHSYLFILLLFPKLLNKQYFNYSPWITYFLINFH